ncbi:MAG: GIY-YIG nuclease family protein [Thalassobaculum sp.]|uniref:GIY-YIG nuclease family protein n=1 Tax=Thalassobaculum sp. TaxID=2022740 RepID=UPI0032EC3AE2
MAAFVYILRCADGSYYVGFTRRPPDERLAIHRSGAVKGYASSRLPVEMVWCAEFDRDAEAFAVERQIKGWSRAKKEALIAGDWDAIMRLARRRGGRPFAAPLPRGSSGR